MHRIGKIHAHVAFCI